MAIAAIAYKCPDTEIGTAINTIADIDPHIMFWVFLPMLLYEDAATSDWHVVRRVLPSALLLALPGVAINTLLTALVLYGLDITDFKASCLLGSILSATDPVAVIGALNALQAPAKLSSIIAGESLLNDGSAVVVFSIFLDVTAERKEFDIGEAIEKLFRLAGGGVALGLAVALAAHIWLSKTRNFSVEIMLIIICIFGLFFAAEHSEIKFSGVLAVVTFGFFMAAVGKNDLDLEKEHEHHAIVNFLSYVSNEAIFIIAGIIGYNFSFLEENIEARDWLDLLLLYIGIHITRGLTVAICYPILHRTGYRLNMREALICVVGGLRGAVGLALALLVLRDEDINIVTRHKICFHTNGIVLGTLFINGLVVTPIYKMLKIQSPTRAAHHHELLKMLLKHADEMVKFRMHKLGKHWFFQDTEKEILDAMVPSLSDGLDHADEDYYGRKRHCIDVLKRTDTKMRELIAKLAANPKDIQDSFRSQLKLSETDKHDHHNIFQAGILLVKHAKELKEKGAKGMKTLSEESKRARARSNASTKSSKEKVRANGSAVQTEASEPKQSNWSSTDEQAESVITEVLTDASGVKAMLDAGRAAGQTELDIDTMNSKKVEVDEADLDDEVSVDEEGDGENRNKVGRRIMAVRRFTHFQAFQTKAESAVKGEPSVYAIRGEPEELGLAIELAQNLVNAQRAAYKQMLETAALSDSAHQFLSAALDFQVEAIDGDLKSYHFLKKDFPELHRQDQGTQLRAAQKVSLAFIRAHMDTTEVPGYRRILTYVNHRSRVCEWMLMRRNIKTLLGYVMVLKQNQEEMEHLKHEYFTSECLESKIVAEMCQSMKEVEDAVKNELIVREVQRQPAMFKLYENILYARLHVVQQIYVLNELTEEGNLEETDVENFIKNITEPSMKALERWIPSLEQLTAIGGKASIERYSSSFDTLVNFANSLTLEPI